MPLSPEEKIDVNILRDKQNELKLRAIEYCLFSRKNGITSTGYATIESLYAGTISRLQADLDKLIVAHLKKYPD